MAAEYGDRSKGTRVYVGGLGESIKKEDLEMEFEKHGQLNSVWVALNPPGFAFIEFANLDDAESACDKLNGAEIMGSKLRVEISRGRGRGRGGGRGSRGSDRGYFSRGGGTRGSYSSERGFRGSRGMGSARDRYGGDSYGSYGGSRDYGRSSGYDGGDDYGGRDSGYRSRSPYGRGAGSRDYGNSANSFSYGRSGGGY